MDKENMLYIHNGVLFSLKEEWNPVNFSKLVRPGGHHIKQNKLDIDRQLSHDLCDM
jgi:hypothetical protein